MVCVFHRSQTWAPVRIAARCTARKKNTKMTTPGKCRQQSPLCTVAGSQRPSLSAFTAPGTKCHRLDLSVRRHATDPAHHRCGRWCERRRRCQRTPHPTSLAVAPARRASLTGDAQLTTIPPIKVKKTTDLDQIGGTGNTCADGAADHARQHLLCQRPFSGQRADVCFHWLVGPKAYRASKHTQHTPTGQTVGSR